MQPTTDHPKVWVVQVSHFIATLYNLQPMFRRSDVVDRKKQELDEFHPVPIMLCRLFSHWLDLQLLQPLVYYVPRPNRVLAVMQDGSIAPDDIF